MSVQTKRFLRIGGSVIIGLFLYSQFKTYQPTLLHDVIYAYSNLHAIGLYLIGVICISITAYVPFALVLIVDDATFVEWTVSLIGYMGFSAIYVTAYCTFNFIPLSSTYALIATIPFIGSLYIEHHIANIKRMNYL